MRPAGGVRKKPQASEWSVSSWMTDGLARETNDHAGLGDWYVNPVKFPHGLKPLIDKVHSLGMDFGLWVEPEMVNPNSELYRKHPDWVLNFPGRPRTEGRNQLVLNLARPDVRAYVCMRAIAVSLVPVRPRAIQKIAECAASRAAAKAMCMLATRC